MLLTHLSEVTEHLPRGLAASLNDPRLEVHDRDPFTGVERGPAEQVAVATTELRALTAALEAATNLAEAAQSAINFQSYTVKSEAS